MLANKLHLKAGMRIAVRNAPAGWSLAAPGVVVQSALTRDLDLVLLFATTQKQLQAQWSKITGALTAGGALWVAYPKKGSGLETDLGMGEWQATKGSGWNPVTMVRVDDTWSAVRLKYAPELDQVRHDRQQEAITDADGTVCVDRVARIVTPPRDLQKLLARSAQARATFDGLSFTNRKEYVVWILDAKKPETRNARLTKTIEKLAAGKKNPAA